VSVPLVVRSLLLLVLAGPTLAVPVPLWHHHDCEPDTLPRHPHHECPVCVAAVPGALLPPAAEALPDLLPVGVAEACSPRPMMSCGVVWVEARGPPSPSLP